MVRKGVQSLLPDGRQQCNEAATISYGIPTLDLAIAHQWAFWKISR